MRKQRSSTFCCCPSTNHCSYERNRNFHLSDKLCRMDGQNYFTTQGQTGTMTSTFSHLPASISSIYQALPDCDLRAPSIVNTTVVDNLLCYVRLDNAEWLNRLSATISRRQHVQFSIIWEAFNSSKTFLVSLGLWIGKFIGTFKIFRCVPCKSALFRQSARMFCCIDDQTCWKVARRKQISWRKRVHFFGLTGVESS